MTDQSARIAELESALSILIRTAHDTTRHYGLESQRQCLEEVALESARVLGARTPTQERRTRGLSRYLRSLGAHASPPAAQPNGSTGQKSADRA